MTMQEEYHKWYQDLERYTNYGDNWGDGWQNKHTLDDSSNVEFGQFDDSQTSPDQHYGDFLDQSSRIVRL